MNSPNAGASSAPTSLSTVAAALDGDVDIDNGTVPKRRRVGPGGQYCSAVGCNNSGYRDGPRGVKFYRYPKESSRRQKWILRVNRTEPNGSLWKPSTNARLCSDHFVSGKKSDEPDDPDYEPSIFTTGHVKPKNPSDLARFDRRKRRHDDSERKLSKTQVPVEETVRLQVPERVSVGEDTYEANDQSFACQENISDKGSSTDTADELGDEGGGGPERGETEAVEACQEPAQRPRPITLDYGTQTLKAHDPKSLGCQTERKITINRATNTDRMKEKKKSNALPITSFPDRQHFAFTGTHKPVFQFLLYRIGDKIADDPKSLKREDKLALVLVKLKMNVRFVNLAAMFDIGKDRVRKVFNQGLLALKSTVECFIIWFDKGTIRARLPRDFRLLYPKTRAIIDCSEVECFTPNDPDLKVKLYSQYKKRFTMKYLIACAPSGEITFVSKMFGGRTTDTEICNKSGFVHLIESGDGILGDKGFPEFDTSVAQKGGVLVMPPFKQSEKGFQFTERQTEEAYKIARVRIHVERAINRMKNFQILEYVYADMREQIDNVLLAISGLCNLSNDLISE